MGNLNASFEGILLEESTSEEKGESLNLLLESRLPGDFSSKCKDNSNPFLPRVLKLA